MPLPDEPEIDEEDQDEAVQVIEAEPEVEVVPSVIDEDASKPPSPKAQLTLSVDVDDTDGSNPLSLDGPLDDMDMSLNPMDPGLVTELNVGEVSEVLNDEGGVELDISALGPDGLGLEGTHDLSQMDPDDVLMGGVMLDGSEDPFGVPQ